MQEFPHIEVSSQHSKFNQQKRKKIFIQYSVTHTSAKTNEDCLFVTEHTDTSPTGDSRAGSGKY